jgi:hypothetical protein
MRRRFGGTHPFHLLGRMGYTGKFQGESHNQGREQEWTRFGPVGRVNRKNGHFMDHNISSHVGKKTCEQILLWSSPQADGWAFCAPMELLFHACTFRSFKIIDVMIHLCAETDVPFYARSALLPAITSRRDRRAVTKGNHTELSSCFV